MLRNLQNEFQEALKASKHTRKNNTPPVIKSYTETIPTNMSGVLLQIVFPTSAGKIYLHNQLFLVCFFLQFNFRFRSRRWRTIRHTVGP